MGDLQGPYQRNPRTALPRTWYSINLSIKHSSPCQHGQDRLCESVTTKSASTTRKQSRSSQLHSGNPTSTNHSQCPTATTTPSCPSVIRKKNAMMRSNLTSGYAGSSVIKSEPFMDKTIQLLEQCLDDLSNKKVPFEFGLWLHFLTWDITGEVMFSKRFGFLDQGQDIGNSIKNNFFLALYLTLTVYAQWIHTTILGNPIPRWLDFHPKEYTFNTTLKAIAARKENPEARADMMEQWMRQQARHPDRMTEHEVLCAAIANLGAASETVGSVLQAFFYLLLKEDPLHLQKLHEEINTADAAGRLSRVVSNAEALKLPYLQACLCPI